jgi:hypothetical protein
MNAQQGAALRTCPLRLLRGKQGVDPSLFDLEKVLHHAHAVLGAVALVELTQPDAREACAFEAECVGATRDLVARLDLAGNAGSWLGGVTPITAGASVLLSEMAAAETAVHATRCDELGMKRLR